MESRKWKWIRAIVALLSLVVASRPGQGLVSGPYSATACVDHAVIGSAEWNFPARAAGSDDMRSTKSLELEETHFLVCTGYNFSIPANDLIRGIVVENEVSVGGADEIIHDHAQRIVRGGIVALSDRASGLPWPYVDTPMAHGAGDDLWGECWCALPPGSLCDDQSCGNVNDPNFGAALAAKHVAGGSGRARVDDVRITIYHEPAPPSPTRTPTSTVTSTPTRTASPTITPTLAVCPSSPAPHCAAPGKSVVRLTGNTSPITRSLTWTWRRGMAAAWEFGDPLVDTAYALCIYSDDALVAGLILLPGGTCGTANCWRSARGRAFSYRNKATNPSGVRSASLRAGAGAARIEVKAQRGNLLIPMPLDPRDALTVQLVKAPGAGRECWGTRFASPAIKSNLDGFEDALDKP